MTAVNYLWNPINDNIVEEFDDDGNTIAEDTTEPNQFGNVISQYRDGKESFYHYDGQGSTLALTDENGDVTDTYAYSAFGEVTRHTGSTVNPFQYIGQKQYYRDAETGEYEVRRRPLSSSQGRWLSQDPLGIGGFNSTYSYANNSPLIFIDPSGLLGQKVVPYYPNPDQLRQWMENHSNPFNGPCASYGLFTTWQLGPGETDGYIIQRVKYKIKGDFCSQINDGYVLCPMPEFSLPDSKQPVVCDDYLEIWRVHNGKVYSNDVFGYPFSISVGWRGQPGGLVPVVQVGLTWVIEDGLDVFANFGYNVSTYGRETKTGEAIFVSTDKLRKEKGQGLFGGDLLTHLAVSFDLGQVRSAGGLYSMCMSALDGATWERLKTLAGEKVSNKSVLKTWNCCPFTPRQSNAIISIDGKVVSLGLPSVDEFNNPPPSPTSELYGFWLRCTDC